MNGFIIGQLTEALPLFTKVKNFQKVFFQKKSKKFQISDGGESRMACHSIKYKK